MTNRRSRKRRGGLLANHFMCRKMLPVVVLTVACLWLQSVDAKQISERKQVNIPNRSSPESDQQQELFQKSNVTSSQANADYVTTTASYSTSSMSSSASKNPQLVSTATPTLNLTLSEQTTPQLPLTSTSTSTSTTAISTLLATETPSSTSKSNTVLSTASPNPTRDNVVAKQWQIQKQQQQPSARLQVVNKRQRNEGNQANSINLEPIDQMSTSQSVSFAEPMMAASNPQESRQRQFQPQVAQQQPQPQPQAQQSQQQVSISLQIQLAGSGKDCRCKQEKL